MLTTCGNNLYRAFGLIISSDIKLSELIAIDEYLDIYDIEIKNGNLSMFQSELQNNPYFHMVKDNQVLFYIPDVAYFSIKDGNSITYSSVSNGLEDLIRLYLLGTCMGVILMQRKVLPLHGSAVLINGKAYAFIGESGAGKSTLASAFLINGCPLITDDIVPISLTNDNCIPFITPTYPQQKLWQYSLDQLGMDQSKYRPIYQREKKYSVPIMNRFINTPIQLAGIFELVKGDKQEIQLLSRGKLEGLHTLLTHTYRNFLVPRLGLMNWHFDVTSKIINQINIYQIMRPTSGFTANELMKRIKSTIKLEENQFAKSH